MLTSRHSNLCLTAKTIAYQALVTQEFCDPQNASQYWAGLWQLEQTTAWFRNLEHFGFNLNTALSQDWAQLGSPILMQTLVKDYHRQAWELHTCIFNGLEQKDC